MSESSLSYRTATFYPLIQRRCSPRIHLVYPTLLLTPLFQDMSHHIQLLLDKRAIEEISCLTPGFYSRIFLTLKKSGDWRPVIDLSALNRFLWSPHFRMEMSTSIMCSLQPGHWATSLDFKDAFFHIPIAPAHRCYLSFRFGHCYFRFQALPFCLATSPYLFTRLVKAVGTFARSQGLSLLFYLDYWNILAPSAPACTAWTLWFLTLSKRLGLVVNMDKCELVPSQRFVFVGIDFDLTNGMARPAPHRVQNLPLSLETFMPLRTPLAVKWQQLLGHMTSLERLALRGRLLVRPLQFALRDSYDQSSDHPCTPVLTPQDVRSALQWWSSPLSTYYRGSPYTPPPSASALH